MDKIDFIELATFCVKRYKEANTGTGQKYESTLYVAILEGNKTLCSTTPHILRNAEQCILIHQKSQVAISNWYSWYCVEYINSEGCVCGSVLENEFKLKIESWGSFSNQVMSLSYGNDNLNLYWCKAPFDKGIQKTWELYSKLKEIKNLSEIKLIADLFKKDEEILELEKKVEGLTFANQLLKQERDQYKDMLDDIKDLLNHKTQ